MRGGPVLSASLGCPGEMPPPISLLSTTMRVARLGLTKSDAPAERKARSPAHHQTRTK
jgi:hypothetical protein